MNSSIYRLLTPTKINGRVHKSGLVELPIEQGDALVERGLVERLATPNTIPSESSGSGPAGASAPAGTASAEAPAVVVEKVVVVKPRASKPKAAAPAKKAAAKKAAK